MDALVDLADAAPLGGKAGALARLVAAGLPVPEGVVLTGAARAGAHAARLAPLAVRSSASIEDAATGSAAGIFASRVGVAAEDAAAAIEEVRASARTPLAQAYARQRGADAIEVAVIVQRFVAGRRVTVYTRPPGRPDADEAWIEPEREGPRRVRRDDGDPWLALALAAERAIGAARGADVELVVGDGATWIVQARPIVHPAPATPRVAAPSILLAWTLETPGVTWRWDVAHNPDPLSPAQASLVDAVVRTGASPWRMHVAAGYLYVADEPRPAPVDAPDVAGLIARFRELAARMDGALATGGDSLAEAVAAYLALYRIYAGEVTPLLAAARRALVAKVGEAEAARRVPRRGGSIEGAIVACARGALDEATLLARLADHAPAWDVAAPTFGERPALVRAAVARIRASLDALPAAEAAPVTDPIVAAARAAATLAEEDDAYFARAQARVRRALLARGAALGLADPDDACWLPIEELLGAEAGDAFDPIAARARAGAARSAAVRARRWAMPVAIRDGAPLAPAAPAGADTWRGAGSGGRVTGVVHRIAALDDAVLVPPGAVVVVPTVTPALAVLLAGARALVTDHGGALDHGAAIARELGLTCVVGCAGAWDALADGDLVEVDGEHGAVHRVA